MYCNVVSSDVKGVGNNANGDNGITNYVRSVCSCVNHFYSGVKGIGSDANIVP